MISMSAHTAVLDALEKGVEQIERDSRAEVVVAIAEASSRYAATTWLAVTATNFLAWFAILYLPFDFAPIFIIPNLLLLAVIVWWLVGKTLLLRRLTPAAQQNQAVQRAARLVFFDENVSATRERVGILVYYSILEGRLEIVADLGIQRCVAEEQWNPLRQRSLQGAPLEELVEVLGSVGKILAERLPREAAGEDELPNRPRLLGVVT